jgi:hypothetical protein
MTKRFTTLLLISLLIIGIAGSVIAGVAVISSVTGATFYCDAVTVDYWSNVDQTYRVVNVDAGDQAVSAQINFPNTGGLTETIQIPLTQTTPDGTVLKLQMFLGTWFDVFNSGTGQIAQGACSGLPAPQPPRYYIGNTGAILALFAVGDVLDFYAVEGSEGFGIFHITAEELDEMYPGNPDVNTLIFQSDDGKLAFYKLTSGEYQINVGPDNDGVVHVFIFTGVPPTNIHIHTFTVFDLISALFALT